MLLQRCKIRPVWFTSVSRETDAPLAPLGGNESSETKDSKNIDQNLSGIQFPPGKYPFMTFDANWKSVPQKNVISAAKLVNGRKCPGADGSQDFVAWEGERKSYLICQDTLPDISVFDINSGTDEHKNTLPKTEKCRSDYKTLGNDSGITQRTTSTKAGHRKTRKRKTKEQEEEIPRGSSEKIGNLVRFSEGIHEEITKFLQQHTLEPERRPYVNSGIPLPEFKEKHCDLYIRAKKRIHLPEYELDELLAYLCIQYSKFFTGTEGTYGYLQRLEDVCDFIIDKYQLCSSTVTAMPNEEIKK